MQVKVATKMFVEYMSNRCPVPQIIFIISQNLAKYMCTVCGIAMSNSLNLLSYFKFELKVKLQRKSTTRVNVKTIHKSRHKLSVYLQHKKYFILQKLKRAQQNSLKKLLSCQNFTLLIELSHSKLLKMYVLSFETFYRQLNYMR